MNQYVLKVIIPDESDTNQFTVYLFDPEKHYLISITTDRWACESILLAKQNLKLIRPHIHDTLYRLLRCFDSEVQCIYIYKVLDDVFYAYLRLVKNGHVLDLDIKVTDAISMSFRFNVPIFIADDVVNRVGIKITKELLEKSLEFNEEY